MKLQMLRSQWRCAVRVINSARQLCRNHCHEAQNSCKRARTSQTRSLAAQAKTASSRSLCSAGQAFYRAESAQARDLAVLAAAIYRKQAGHLYVLDAMCGCGLRAKRYLLQAGADSVWSNDVDPRNTDAIIANMTSALECPQQSQAMHPHLRKPITEVHARPGPAEACSAAGDRSALLRGRVSNIDAKRLLAACHLSEAWHDLIDVDMFGSDTAAVGPALDCLRFGGLLYLTGTDGFSSSGKRPARALAAYGSYTQPLPFHAEQGLRALVGGAVREAATRGLRVQPLFSLYSPHGPVLRAMVRVTRSRAAPGQEYGFVGCTPQSGEAWRIPFSELGDLGGWRPGADAPGPKCRVAGPMWLGPLHDTAFLQAMQQQADAWGWAEHAFETPDGVKMTGHNPPKPLEQLLELLLEESHPALPPWYVLLSDVRTGCGLPEIPRRADVISALRNSGFVAAATHAESRAIKTTATMAEMRDVLLQQQDSSSSEDVEWP